MAVVNDMTSIRINWLQAFEATHGRKVVVTRQELLAFHASAPSKGPLGMPLNYPSWLTNPKPNKWKVGRAAYKLPWDELDRWLALGTTSTPVEPVVAAQPDDVLEANDPEPSSLTFTVAEMSNNVTVSA